ncbi:Crp/Fnr family transcriptional regulator [Mucilaginibacter koreensis]
MSNRDTDTAFATQMLMQWLQARPEHISMQEAIEFCSLFQYKQLQEGQHVFTHGRRVNYIYFVAGGCFRLYIRHYDGTEQTLGFYEENEFVADPYSFIEEQPTTLSLQATEDGHLLAINRTQWNLACKSFNWYLPIHKQNIEAQLQGLYQFLSGLKANGPTLCYQQLVQNRARLLQRLPAHLLAAYLGVTPGELNQIKAALGSPA